jgi:hypothetical protein
MAKFVRVQNAIINIDSIESVRQGYTYSGFGIHSYYIKIAFTTGKEEYVQWDRDCERERDLAFKKMMEEIENGII